VVNENLTEARQVTVKPLNAAHKVSDIATGKSSLSLTPGDGAVFVVNKTM